MSDGIISKRQMSLLLGEDEVTANGHLDAADLMVTSGAAAPNGVTNGELVVTSSGQEYIVVVTDGGAGVAAQGQKEHGLQYVEQEEFQVPNIGGAVEIGDNLNSSVAAPVAVVTPMTPPPSTARPFRCPHCEYCATRRDTLNNHVATVHEGKKPYACSQCSFKTARKAALDKHVRRMHQEAKKENAVMVEGIVCALCGNKCAGTEDLKHHIRVAHSELFPGNKDVVELVCALCGRKCDDTNDLKVHLNVMHPEFCQKKNGPRTVQVKVERRETVEEFAAREVSKLSQPLPLFQQDGKLYVIGSIKDSSPQEETILSPPAPPATAAKDRGYACGECGYKAVNQYKLSSHVKIVHEKRKPFICSTCDFRTVTVNKLNNHIAEVHQRQKPFGCKWCEFRSARQYNLNVHISQVHLGEKPFGCKICDYRAARKDKIRRHLVVAHGRNESDTNDFIDVQKSKTLNLTDTSGTSNGTVVFSTEENSSNDQSRSSREHQMENGVEEEYMDNLSFIDLLPKEPVPTELVMPGFIKQETFATTPGVSSPVFISLGQVPPAETTVDVTTGQEEIILTTEENPATGQTVIVSTNLPKKQATTSNSSTGGKRRIITPEEMAQRKYECQFCDYKAARSNTLKMHIIAVHEQAKTFACDMCSYKTARRGDFNRHTKTVHKKTNGVNGESQANSENKSG